MSTRNVFYLHEVPRFNIDQIENYQMLHLFTSLIPIDQILNEQVQAVPAVPKSH